MQVYLPDELYRLVKKEGLPASELLQEAVRVEVRKRALLRETDRYLNALRQEVGEPTARHRERTQAIMRRIRERKPRRTG
jgi:post-segregation antitoxin (ccd killing protein)